MLHEISDSPELGTGYPYRAATSRLLHAKPEITPRKGAIGRPRYALHQLTTPTRSKNAQTKGLVSSRER